MQEDLLEQLYREYEQKLYIIAVSILHNEQQAEDAVHDTFLKISKELSKIKDVKSIETKRFMIITLKNTAIDMYRRNKRESQMFTNDMEVSIESGYDLEKKYVDTSYIKEILEWLLPIYREVIQLKCFYGFNNKEIADILDVSEAAVCKRFSRAKIMIQSKMGDEKIG